MRQVIFAALSLPDMEYISEVYQGVFLEMLIEFMFSLHVVLVQGRVCPEYN